MSSTAAPFPVDTRFFTISTAGHVDHGKTSLIKALTGIDPDRLKEEKERQMTTDLGFAHLVLNPQLIVGFVDVPGHGKFLKNMLAGVGGIDMALLVVAADEGPMPQTRQHVRILSLLGVRRVLVALSKIDLVDDPEYQEAVASDIGNLLLQHGMDMISLVPVSSSTSVGLDKLKAELGRALSQLPRRDIAGGAYLPIDRVFSKTGFGTVVTGTVVRGKLSVGDQVTLLPEVASGRVRRLETFGHSVGTAGAGQRVAVNLVLKENRSLSRGQVVAGTMMPATTSLLVSLVDSPALSEGSFAEKVQAQPIRLYHGTAECHGYVRWAKPAGGNSVTEQSSTLVAFLALDNPLVALPGDRFVVRLSDETIFGGEVILRQKPKWLKHDDLLSLSELVLYNEWKLAALKFVQCAPQSLAKKEQLAVFLPPSRQQELVESLLSTGQLVLLGESLMLPETRAVLASKLKQTLARALAQKQNDMDSDSVALEVVRGLFLPRLERSTYQALIDAEVSNGWLMRTGEKLSLASGTTDKVLDASAVELRDRVSNVLQQNFCLEVAELARVCDTDLSQVKAVVQAMVKQGQLVIVNYDFAISCENLSKAHRALADIWQRKKNIAPTDFREALGTTRKYAMALLQHFDDARVTRRLDSGRVLLRGPDKV